MARVAAVTAQVSSAAPRSAVARGRRATTLGAPYWLPTPLPVKRRVLALRASAVETSDGGSSTTAPTAAAASRGRHSGSRASHSSSGNHPREHGHAADSPETSAPSSISKALRSALVAFLASVQVATPFAAVVPGDGAALLPPQLQQLLQQQTAAQAVLLSPDTKVPKNADVALRRAVPVVNPALRKVQEGLEEIFVLLRIPQRKPYGRMESNVKTALKSAEAEQAAILAAVPEEQRSKASELLTLVLKDEKRGLPGLLNAIAEKDAERVASRTASTLQALTDIAVLQAPGLPYLLPAQFADLPRLTGRAVVELEVLRGDGSTFAIENGAGSTKTGVLRVVLDGYSAPLTAGNFAQIVSLRGYDGVAVKANQQAVLTEARDPSLGKELPLELMPSGDFQPIYRTPLDVADGELPVLPMSVYGAVVMAHAGVENDSFNHPSQFFFYLYDKRNSGLGGLAFDEGQFSVFGYVTSGRDILGQLRTGDVIQSARLVSGADRLVVP